MIQYIPIIGGLIEKWMSGRQNVKKQSHTEQMAVYEQFAAEFRDMKNRTWWDSLIDGLNRLPRPVMTFGVIWLFWFCVDNPAGFVVSAEALKAMPYEGWVALWMVIGFWFGTKAVEKLPDKFGKLSGRSMPKIEINAPRSKKLGNPSDLITNHEDMNWTDKKEKRYERMDDWDNLND